MLEVFGIDKTLGGRKILEQVDLRCAPSEVIVLTGENGSGKTTLLRIIAGMIQPSHGTIRICGCSLALEPVLAKTHLGYVPDGLDALPELLVSEFVALVAVLKANAKGKPALVDSAWKERLGIQATWGQRLRSLSFGQRKRVTLLAALIGSPALLILDEPSNGLDPSGVALIRALIEERHQTAMMTILSTNDVEFESTFASTRYHLEAGKLASRARLETDAGMPGCEGSSALPGSATY